MFTWGGSERHLTEYQVCEINKHLGGRDVTGVHDVFDNELLCSDVKWGEFYSYPVVGIKAAWGCLITVGKIRGLDKSNTFLSFGDIKFVWEDQAELAGIWYDMFELCKKYISCRDAVVGWIRLDGFISVRSQPKTNRTQQRDKKQFS